MNASTCRLCKCRNVFDIGEGVVLDIPVTYFECHDCGYVQTEYPHWIDRAYSDVIKASDTGIYRLRVIFTYEFLNNNVY